MSKKVLIRINKDFRRLLISSVKIFMSEKVLIRINKDFRRLLISTVKILYILSSTF